MTLAAPLWLLSLVPVAALAVAYVVMQARRRRYTVRFTNLAMLEKVAPRRPGWRRHLPAALTVLGLAALCVAAARPQVDSRVPYDRATVMLALDVSSSMAATDVSPDRLSAAEEAAARFVEELPDTVSVGVVTFARTANVVSAPTTDHEQVSAALENLRTNGGTAIGDGVTAALGQIRELAAKTPSGQSVPARVVLLSDGANTVGSSVESAAEQARDIGVPVSTIAYGTPEGTIDIGGRPTLVPVDSETLGELARDTDGTAYTASDSAQLRSVYDDIGAIVGYRNEPREITAWLAVLALALAFGSAALSLRWFARVV